MPKISQVQPEYAWLEKEPGPKHLLIAIEYFGLKEKRGKGSNVIILDWAIDYGGWVKEFFKDDDIPWCGLFMGHVMKRAGRACPKQVLTALAWSDFGLAREGNFPRLGDVLTFSRKGGGHVGLYVGEDAATYHVLGGNQRDGVNVARLEKKRLFAKRKPPYHTEPANVRRILLNTGGAISTNEA